MTSLLPIECADPDDRMDGWQVGYYSVKAKEPIYEGYKSTEHKFKVWPLPHHPGFQPFPYREIKPTVDIEV